MNFWDWPCEMFFSKCTFDIVAGILFAIILVILIPASALILRMFYGGFK